MNDKLHFAINITLAAFHIVGAIKTEAVGFIHKIKINYKS